MDHIKLLSSLTSNITLYIGDFLQQPWKTTIFSLLTISWLSSKAMVLNLSCPWGSQAQGYWHVCFESCSGDFSGKSRLKTSIPGYFTQWQRVILKKMHVLSLLKNIYSPFEIYSACAKRLGSYTVKPSYLT